MKKKTLSFVRLISFLLLTSILGGCFMSCDKIKFLIGRTEETEQTIDTTEKHTTILDSQETTDNVSPTPNNPTFPDDPKDEPDIDDTESDNVNVIKDDIPLFAEIWRPTYHFTDKNGFINDPNGLCYFNGTYHIYYQLNPEKNYKDSRNVHWGHATSKDLVHFEIHDPVLAPDEFGAMWSGTAYVDTDNRSGLFRDGEQGIIAAYSTHTQKIGIAYSKDGFQFTKLGIVIDNTEIDKFRDPKLFYDDISGKWTMIMAGGMVRFYQSSDLRNWTCVSENTDILTECPDFFEMKIEGTDITKWVLSGANRTYYVGTWNGTTFVSEQKIGVDSGESYAGLIFANEPKGRLLMMKWLNSMKMAERAADGIWNGAMTLVNELSLRLVNGKYVIIQKPVEEYDAIIGEEIVSLTNTAVGADNLLKNVDSQTYMIDLRIGADKDFVLNVLQSEAEAVSFSWNAVKKTLIIDRSKNDSGSLTLSQTSARFIYTIDDKFITNGILSLVVFVDTSCCDYYICDGAYVGNIRYQPLPTSRGASLVSADGSVVKSLTVKEIDNIYFADKKVDSILTVDKLVQVLQGKSIVHAVCDFYGRNDYQVESLDSNIVTASVCDGGISICGVSVGETWIKVYNNGCTIYLKVKVYKSDNLNCEVNSYLWSDQIQKTYEGYTVDGTERKAFILTDSSLGAFEYSGNVKVIKEGGEVAFLFRATDASNYYSLVLNFQESCIKLLKAVKGVTTVLRNKTYSLSVDTAYSVKIVAKGSNIQVYVDDALFCSVSDAAHANGYLGLYANKAKGIFNGLRCQSKNQASNYFEDFESIEDAIILTEQADKTVSIGDSEFKIRVKENSKFAVENGVLSLKRDGTTTDAFFEVLLADKFLSTEKYTFEMSVKASDNFNARGAFFSVFSYQFVKYKTDGSITNNAGTTIGRLNNEQYVKIALTVDCENGTYEIFIDDVRVDTGIFTFKDTSNVRVIHFFANGNSTLYVDYVKISVATESES